ncbi:MAG TPA: D-glycero-beta-D-manno-heptose 1-phosphate adenylyltransferase [Clostridiales bacterium]|jgi:rfaE bifunctional protein nucleotidyltransferase chain/domain|nr:D-glycero-beta-D-manno-heptose 1-phosphate adenylyltransferase [Clostridiales bacterium]HQP69690.1 D-glycero-beta-D-manno-heptose 1-phosphate adenylyltransferase [Clostridiales bacterium]
MIISRDQLKYIASGHKKKGLRIVFTNGVFDIIHRGHAEYLAASKKAGDVLIVGINSDSSVKRLKGNDRPVNCQEDRMIVLDSLKPVDYTVLFEEDSPLGLIEAVNPDVLVKGGDYDPSVTDPSDKKYIVGSDIVKKAGGRVITIELVAGRSTTGVIRKMRGSE